MKCDEEGCYEMAMVSIKKDLFGKSDATRNLCSKHAPRYSMVSSQVNEKAVGGSDVCHTCEAHVVAILDLEKERDALAAELAQQKGWHANWLKVEPQYIARIDALEAALRPLAMAAKSWHDFHHDDAGFSAVQCDEICKALPTALAVLTPSETICGECGGSGLTMQPGMPDGEPEGKPCPKCSAGRAVETPVEPTLICPKCGVDRYKQACRALTLDCPMHGETACGEKPPIGFGVPTLADRVKEIMKETGATFECALQTTAHECELRSEAIFAVRQYFDHYEPKVNRG